MKFISCCSIHKRRCGDYCFLTSLHAAGGGRGRCGSRLRRDRRRGGGRRPLTVQDEDPLPADLGHCLVGQPVHLAVVDLQTLLGGEGRGAVALLAQERFHAQMNQHVLLEVGVLRELLVALCTHVALLSLVNLLYVPVERILGTEEDLAAVRAVQLFGALVHLLDVQAQGLGVEVDSAARSAQLSQGLVHGVDAVLVLDQAVVRLEALLAVAAPERHRRVLLAAVLDDVLRANQTHRAVGAVVNPKGKEI